MSQMLKLVSAPGLRRRIAAEPPGIRGLMCGKMCCRRNVNVLQNKMFLRYLTLQNHKAETLPLS